MIFLLFGCIATVVAIDVSSCAAPVSSSPGFHVNFYKYPLLDYTAWNDPDFFTTGYTQFGLAGTVLTSNYPVNFQVNLQQNQVVEGFIYGQLVDASNITVELSGFFVPPITGDYSFTLTADDGASFQLGASPNGCCNSGEGSIKSTLDLNTLASRGGGTATSSIEFTLTEGVFYPLKLVTTNWNGPGSLYLTMYDPYGDYYSDISSFISQATYADGICTTTITSTWENPFTSTTTALGSSTNTVIVEVPHPATTLTSTWTGSETSTITFTGETNTVLVNVPFLTTTTTSTWTGSVQSETTISGNPVTLVIEVPYSTTTITSTWAESFTSTDTISGDTVTVLIDVPTPTTTVTTTWTGETENIQTLTGKDAVTVLVQEPYSTTTTTTTWSNSYESTTTVTGENVTVIVELATPLTSSSFLSDLSSSSSFRESSSLTEILSSSSASESSSLIKSLSSSSVSVSESTSSGTSTLSSQSAATSSEDDSMMSFSTSDLSTSGFSSSISPSSLAPSFSSSSQGYWNSSTDLSGGTLRSTVSPVSDTHIGEPKTTSNPDGVKISVTQTETVVTTVICTDNLCHKTIYTTACDESTNDQKQTANPNGDTFADQTIEHFETVFTTVCCTNDICLTSEVTSTVTVEANNGESTFTELAPEEIAPTAIVPGIKSGSVESTQNPGTITSTVIGSTSTSVTMELSIASVSTYAGGSSKAIASFLLILTSLLAFF